MTGTNPDPGSQNKHSSSKDSSFLELTGPMFKTPEEIATTLGLSIIDNRVPDKTEIQDALEQYLSNVLEEYGHTYLIPEFEHEHPCTELECSSLSFENSEISFPQRFFAAHTKHFLDSIFPALHANGKLPCICRSGFEGYSNPNVSEWGFTDVDASVYIRYGLLEELDSCEDLLISIEYSLPACSEAWQLDEVSCDDAEYSHMRPQHYINRYESFFSNREMWLQQADAK